MLFFTILLILIAIIWFAYSSWAFAYVRFKNNEIQYFSFFKIQKIKTVDLIAINFHYDIVLGAMESWEFKSRNKKSIIIPAKTFFINKVLKSLETKLSDFTLKNFEKIFNERGFEENIEIWKVKKE